jgi:hypothetical protein
MNPPAAKTSNGSPRATLRQRRLYAVWAVAFILLGLALLALNLSFSGPFAALAMAWPALIILAGIVVLWVSRAARDFVPPAYAVGRGECEAACLQVSTFATDVRVGAFVGTTQLVVGQFADPAGPRVRTESKQTRLVLDQRAAPPFIAGDWTADLVKGLAWSFELQTVIGHYLLNLRDLTLGSFALRSLAGNVEMTLPATGQGELDLRLTFGDVTVRAPEGMAVKIRVWPGPLASVRLDDRLFIKTDKNEWVTPYYSSAPNRYSLTIALGTGDLTVT